MRGDCSAQGGDHSAADMALCSHLAFWLGGDAGRVDRVFRSSGLMREKWDSRRGGTTYGAQTVDRAVAGCSEFYRPRRKRNKNACSTSTRRAAAKGLSQDGGSAGHHTGVVKAESRGAGDGHHTGVVKPESDGEPDFSRAPSCESWAVTRGGGSGWSTLRASRATP